MTTCPTKRRRPSLVFLLLLRLPYIVGSIIIAWIVLMMMGCAARPVAPVPALRDPLAETMKRDARFYHWPAPAPETALLDATHLAAPEVARRTETVTDQAVPVTLAWHQPGTCLGWRIEESSDLLNWQPLKTVWCEYVFRDRAVTTTVTTSTSAAFFRVASFYAR